VEFWLQKPFLGHSSAQSVRLQVAPVKPSLQKHVPLKQIPLKEQLFRHNSGEKKHIF